MPLMPEIPTWETSTLNTQTFLGLNRGQSISDGEMADMKNLTSDGYPVLSVRKPRGLPPTLEPELTIYQDEITGMVATQNELLYCVGGDVYLNGEKTGMTLSAEDHMTPKHIAIMGTTAYIWPDKKYISLLDPTDNGDMGQAWASEKDSYISAAMCRKDGRLYDTDEMTISSTAPEEPENLALWLDTSADTSVLKQYSTTYEEWIQVATTYIKLQADGIGKGLKEGDAVFITGAKIKAIVTESPDPDPEPEPDPEPDPTPTPEPEETTAEFSATGDVSLWCQFSVSSDGKTAYTRKPSMTKTIEVTGIPNDATITEAKLTYTLTEPSWGVKTLTCNGQSIKPEADEDEKISWPVSGEMPVEVLGDGAYSFYFVFLCNKDWGGNVGTHSGTLNIKDIKLSVTYTTTELSASGRGDTDDTQQIEALNTSNIVYACGDNYIVVAGLLHHALSLYDTLKCEMKIPDLDYVCEANNRLWGCSYVSINGVQTNEIRCCALGDSRNWYRFEGTSMDSYVMSIGSDGKFTGAFNLQGTPLFFKENYLHKISGTMPSNYALNTLKCRGVQDGCWRSMAVVNETMYYQSRHDVMAYDGSQPYAVGEKLGNEAVYTASGGGYRDKYYLNRMTESGSRTYVYDTAKSLWHIECDYTIPWMANCMGQLVLVLNNGTTKSVMMSIGSDIAGENSLKWSATFGVFGYAYERAKYLSRFNIRAKMDAGSEMKFEIMYDSCGEWEEMGEMKSRTTRTFMLPVVPRRCDHCQIRISGTGNVIIYSIARVFEEGGN